MKQGTFSPNYENILNTAYNREVARTPLYEHLVSTNVMEELTNTKFTSLYGGDEKDVEEFFRNYSGFFRDFGYDTVSFEHCVGGAMPGGGALGNSRMDPAIKTRDDFEKYPWDEVPVNYFKQGAKYFEALRKTMPAGMKAIGGVGNGIFECVQDITGYEKLCFIAADDPELFADLFRKVGETNLKIWKEFMEKYSDMYCVLRFGDDLGFKSTTLLAPDVIRENVLTGYKPIIDEVHRYKKPFLLHSCGCLFNVFDDIIAVGIDAKHSNEDQIAPFSEWVMRYGDKIGNFGGIDTDAICQLDRKAMTAYIHNVLDTCKGHGGIAFGCGNSIPDYVPAENYLNMIEIVREYRGDYQ